jgi:hypothetical protein
MKRTRNGGIMELVEWLAKQVTDDPRALRWFAEPGCDLESRAGR